MATTDLHLRSSPPPLLEYTSTSPGPEPELPAIRPSSFHLPHPPSRKRSATRAYELSYDSLQEDALSVPHTSSDPALFSSDETPDADNYDGPKRRKKRKWVGTWWGERARTTREGSCLSNTGSASGRSVAGRSSPGLNITKSRAGKRSFRRNYDSGVFMPSDDGEGSSSAGTDSELSMTFSSDSGFGNELLEDQKRLEAERNQGLGTGMRPSAVRRTIKLSTVPMPAAPAAPASPARARPVFSPRKVAATQVEDDRVLRARAIVQSCIERSQENVDLSDLLLEDLPSDIKDIGNMIRERALTQEHFDAFSAKPRLFLSNNLLRKVPLALFEVTSLRVLSLRRNKLTRLPPAIRSLVHLKSLNVAGNKLEYLPREILDLVRRHKLTDVHLDPNPWTEPDEQSLRVSSNVELEEAILSLAASCSGRPPRLAELVLRQLAQHNATMSDLRSLMPPDTPLAPLRMLESLHDAQHVGGHQCAKCERKLVEPARKELIWVESRCWTTGEVAYKLLLQAVAAAVELRTTGDVDSMEITNLIADSGVEDVTLSRRGEQAKGTLHLTPHHIIFVSQPSTAPAGQPPQRPKELWITYPIISFCTLRPSPASSRQPSSIRLRCRDFTFVCLYLNDDRQARDVYDSIKAWTCKLGRIEKLYAFTYKPIGAERDITPQGWSVYDPMREWRRQGVISNSNGKEAANPVTPTSNWRISKINTDYAFSPTYPALLAVPNAISDNTLNYAGRYRSRARIPVLSYLHPVNKCTITRCSQPMLGVRQNRSIQDEKLMAAIFDTTRAGRPLSGFVSPTPEREDSGTSSKDGNALNSMAGDLQQTSTEAMEDAVIAKLRGDEASGVVTLDEDGDVIEPDRPVVYGAQQKNMIVDARPTINAYAMQAAGMGSENMDNYKFATKAYLGIDNIHVMRDSLNKVIDTLKDSDLTPLGPNKDQLMRSNWLKHIANMLDGVSLIARQVGLQHSHVLIHCSDGWDRTSQLSALAQICLDPYYRTLEGFIVLVEKDWVSFGHRFHYRSGFLNSEKWFQIENERISGRDEDRDGGKDAIAGAQKSLENAFLSARGFFTKHNNDSRESINVDSEAEVLDVDAVPGKRGKNDKDKNATKVKETAPIFHQFLDATWQLMYQHPTRFEFNERFLRRLLYHLYSCQYGTFLYDTERERKENNIAEKTTSVWNYFLSRKKEFMNPEYDPEIDDNVRGKERLIFPRTQETRWWHSVFGRTDDEMNGSTRPMQAYSNDANDDTALSRVSASHQPEHSGDPHSLPVSRARSPVLIGVETADAAIGVASPPKKSSLDGASEVRPDVGSISASPLLANAYKNKVATSAAQLDGLDTSSGKSTTSSSFDKVSSTTVESNQAVVLPLQQPDSAPEQAQVLASQPRTVPQDDGITTTETSQAKSDLAEGLADDMDPLGIGDVKEHVPTSTKALQQRREQLAALMQ